MLFQDKPAALAPSPLLDERSLFTKAATYGDRGDPYYHPPSSRIGSYYTPTASTACDLLDKVRHPSSNHEMLKSKSQRLLC